jgi:adenosylcobyric acid synthase
VSGSGREQAGGPRALGGLVLLIGGARSGKSRLALALASAQPESVVFIATGERSDPEMSERIERHRSERPGSWRTVEEPLLLIEALEGAAAASCVVIDCLTLWSANTLRAYGAVESERMAAAAANAARSRGALTIAVSNEVGSGIVPGTPLGRVYRDLLGRVNTFWAEAAGEVCLLVAGRALRLAPPDELFESLR